jgi:hypothetical protein
MTIKPLKAGAYAEHYRKLKKKAAKERIKYHRRSQSPLVVKAMADLDKLPGIKKALDDGNQIHIFRSGGGLRVVRIEKEKYGGELLGYGEHYDVLVAFQHASDDYLAGQRNYHEVYGKLYPHYLTGRQEASCELDRAILCGASPNIKKLPDGKIRYWFEGYLFDCNWDGVKAHFEKIGRPFLIIEARCIRLFEASTRGWSAGTAYPGSLGKNSEEFEGIGTTIEDAFEQAQNRCTAAKIAIPISNWSWDEGMRMYRCGSAKNGCNVYEEEVGKKESKWFAVIHKPGKDSWVGIFDDAVSAILKAESELK